LTIGPCHLLAYYTIRRHNMQVFFYSNLDFFFFLCRLIQRIQQLHGFQNIVDVASALDAGMNRLDKGLVFQ